MTQINAMALALAICGATATYLFMQFGGGLSLWAAFVAWASFFHSGGQRKDALTTAACAIFGCLLGGVTMFLITGTPMGELLSVPIWGAVVVFVSAGIAVLSSRIPVLATVPITMQALACIAAFVVLTGAGGTQLLQPSLMSNAILNVSVSMVIGVGFGVLTATLAGLFTANDPQVT